MSKKKRTLMTGREARQLTIPSFAFSSFRECAF